MKKTDPYVLDVRPLLAEGGDPFTAIMNAKAELQAGQALHLIAPFEPLPLIGRMESEGFSASSEMIGEGDWMVRFTPAGNSGPELDVRELEPPGPLQQALEAVSKLSREETLTLQTRFRPVHLFEQLEGSGFEWESEEVGEFHWTSHIWRSEDV